MDAEARIEGPNAPGGIPTFKGRAGTRDVHWLAWEADGIDSREQYFATVSRLSQLMMLNAYTLEGLTSAETAEAKALIFATPEVEGTCSCGSRPIGDTGLCRYHNLYALETRN